MGESHALKDDVLTALYLEDSLTDSSTSPADRFMQCHTDHGRSTAQISVNYKCLGVPGRQRLEYGARLSLMRTQIISVRTLEKNNNITIIHPPLFLS